MTIIIVAELGANPNKYHWNTEAFCEAAAKAGATHVKIQLFKPTHFPKDEQQSKELVTFPRDTVAHFAMCARDYNLHPGASVFDFEAIELCEQYMDFIKLATREERSFDLLLRASMTGLPVYRSIDFRKFLKTKKVRTLFNENILACIPEYPTKGYVSQLPIGIEKLPAPYGWSSHTRSYQDVETAIVRGATIIEKHLKLSNDEPEAEWSFFPHEFEDMVKRIQRAQERRYEYFG